MRIVYWPKIQIGKALITEQLSAQPGVELVVADTLPQVLEALQGAAGMVLADAPEAEAHQVTEAIRAGGTVRWMHFVSAGREGFEAVGLPAGVAVTYAAGAAAPAVAEHAMALLLAAGRRIADVLAQQAERHWDRALPASRAWALEDKTLVIVGYGQIGREIAKRAKPFGARIVAVSRTTPAADALVDEGLPMHRLHEALARADAVMISVALTADTQHLINGAALSALKPGALLVNVARGGVVDQAALRDALHGKRLAGAALDVVDPEPLPASDPLWDSPNLILSPHFAGSGSPASARRLAQGAAENLRRFMAGEPLLHQIAG